MATVAEAPAASKKEAAEAARASAEVFGGMGIPVFPILIRQDKSGKWDKIPLIDRWVVDAGLPKDQDWTGANGVGLLMGDGWYALDVDAHKPGAQAAAVAWVDAHKVPRQTRQHRTVSGGYHLIYRLPPAWKDLRTRANVVTGLDTRGQGGFIAFGPGYKVVAGYDVEPAMLPEAACIALDRPKDGNVIVMSGEPAADRGVVREKLRQALIIKSSQLYFRWNGNTAGMIDTSRSALDMAVARYLAFCGMTEGEIVTALLEFFEHGQARNLEGWRAERAARRCAARACIDAWSVVWPETANDSKAVADIMAGLVRQQQSRRGQQ